MTSRKAFLLRMDPALWAELEAWAQDELRSVNGQIEYVLKQAVLKRKGKAAPPHRATSNPSTHENNPFRPPPALPPTES